MLFHTIEVNGYQIYKYTHTHTHTHTQLFNPHCKSDLLAKFTDFQLFAMNKSNKSY